MTTLVAQVQFVFVALLLRSSLAQYSTYESGEEDEREESQPEDYSRYFSGATTSGLGSPGPAEGGGDSAGFVTPLDFNGIFTGANFALDGLAGGASQQVFSQPVSSLGFNPNTATNSSGFVRNDVNFRSLFDTSGSASESGFRPSDFLPGSNAQATSHGAFFSPAFSSLKHDVDREVSYQNRESATPEVSGSQSRATSRRHPVEDDEDESGEYDHSEYDSGEQPSLDPNDRSPHKYIKQPYEEEREGRHNSDRKSTPYSTSSYRKAKPHYHYQSETRPFNKKLKQPLPAVSEEEDDDDEPLQYNKPYSGQSGQRSYPSVRPPIANNYESKYPANNKYKQVNKPAKPKTFYSSNQYKPAYSSGPPKTIPPYSKPGPNYSPLGPQSTRSYPNGPPSDFRPSPRDPYLDPHQSSPHDVMPVRPSYRQTSPEGIYPLPQTEFATVVRKNPGQLVAAATENKSCRKIQKNIDPKDFSRFKRQQMTCYICTDRDKGNKYEECSYESPPKGNSFYKGSAEAYSSETITPKKTFITRSRRSIHFSGAEENNERYLRVKRQQRFYPEEIDEQGHGSQNYRFGPQHFRKVNTPNKQRHQDLARNKQVKRDYDEDDYDEEEHYDDEDDVEREYSPPGASDNDRCRRVEKDNGLTCMVCENPKSGGSYQQCSYASEPDENKYEYARQSTYGTKRPRNDRYKRQTREHVDHGSKRKGEYTRYARPQNKQRSSRRNDDFRDGKLKRKKVREADYQKRPVRYSVSKSKHDKQRKKNDDGIVGLDPFFYGSPGKKYNPDDYDLKGRKIKRKVQKNKKQEDGEAAATSSEDYADDEEEEEDDPSYEESFYRLFPELVGTDPYTGERRDGNPDDRDDKGPQENYDHPPIPYEEAEDEEESESVRKVNKVKPVYEYNADLPGYFADDESKKDLEKALDEFTHKNRSECKKVIRDHMTCYQCLDSKGMQHEECMYVASSEPKKKHLAYHEVKEFKITPSKTESEEQPKEVVENEKAGTDQLPQKVSKLVDKNEDFKTQRWRSLPAKSKAYESRQIEPSVQPAVAEVMPDSEGQPTITYDILKTTPTLKKPFFKKKTRKSPSEKMNPKTKDFMITAESRTRSVLVRQEEDPNSGEHKRDGNENKAEDEGAGDSNTDEEEEKESQDKRPNYNSIPPDPEGFYDREGPEGAYTHETEPVYDSVLKITLPKYMLTKSEHEEIFDEVLRSG